ncbi:MAG: LUD domain-containing protein [Patescibacteria group bacterium]
MENNKKFSELASEMAIDRTVSALKKNGFIVYVVNNREEARIQVFDLLPDGVEIMNMSSMTLTEIGLDQEILNSSRYKTSRRELAALRPDQIMEKQRLGAAPEYAIGSVHAVTENGEVLIASATGSQLPAYAYGARFVIWVVGSQKIVEDLTTGFQRLNEYCLPLENERALKAYGQGSGLNKILQINKEVQVGRIIIVIVKEKLGF